MHSRLEDKGVVEVGYINHLRVSASHPRRLSFLLPEDDDDDDGIHSIELKVDNGSLWQ